MMSRLIFLFSFFIFIAQPGNTAETEIKSASKTKPYEAKNYESLLNTTSGIDKDLLNLHFKLYQGYVKNSNAILQILEELSDKGEELTPQYGALKKNLGWEFDGMLLHEYYFENLGNHQALSPSDPLYLKIEADFGSYDKWKKDFTATGLVRGIGWVVAYIEPKSGRLINEWIEEHHIGHIAAGTPILVMDVFEHAYITQFGLKKEAYIDLFFKNINWEAVSQRFSTRPPMKADHVLQN